MKSYSAPHPIGGGFPNQGFQEVDLEAYEEEAEDAGLYTHETIVHDLIVEDLLQEHSLDMAA